MSNLPGWLPCRVIHRDGGFGKNIKV